VPHVRKSGRPDPEARIPARAKGGDRCDRLTWSEDNHWAD
jgi:hypothetical protein